MKSQADCRACDGPPAAKPWLPLAVFVAASVLAGSALVAGPARAASSASSAASEGASASIGSLSASVQTLSDSATRPLRFAQGEHRVAEIAPAAGREGFVAMRLLAVAPAADAEQAAGLTLVLPARTLEATAIAPGDRVDVRDLAHGLEFAHGQPQRVFYLALRDQGLGDLRTRPLSL